MCNGTLWCVCVCERERERDFLFICAKYVFLLVFFIHSTIHKVMFVSSTFFGISF
jgi:hypothetical protein